MDTTLAALKTSFSTYPNTFDADITFAIRDTEVEITEGVRLLGQPLGSLTFTRALKFSLLNALYEMQRMRLIYYSTSLISTRHCVCLQCTHSTSSNIC